jgi:hypothetical protein
MTPFGPRETLPVLTKVRPVHANRFDQLFALGRDALLAGTHSCESAPVDGGARYGLSVILRPDPDAAERLAQVGAEAAAYAGNGHWPSGEKDLVHFTVRSLEAHRVRIPADDPLVARSTAAMRKAACGPIRMRLTGLTLTAVSVMVCAQPLDGAAERFAAELGREVGEAATYDGGRDIWYTNVLHFAGPVADPEGLVSWVAQRRMLDLGETVFDIAELCQWVPDPRRPAPKVLASAAL